MNTNLNNIPLEIFLDYCTEQTGQEWTIQHITTLTCYNIAHFRIHHKGDGYSYHTNTQIPFTIGIATGDGYGLGCEYGKGIAIYGSKYAFGNGNLNTTTALGDGNNEYQPKQYPT